MVENTVRYNGEKLMKFKQILEDKLNHNQEQLDKLVSDQQKNKDHVANANLDFNENSKHFQQQAKNDRLIARLQNKVSELESALGRIEDGTYGVCEKTGRLIREERLMAMPTARTSMLGS